jgi:translation initiation factor IF-2
MLSKEKSTLSLFPRPPVVAILGHVDHGKTTLLDAIRSSNVAAKEHGGITQHIGAYQIDYKGEKITFIDTPGHAAFAKMRSHGVSVTDLVILVVAADDGVQPQTKESIAHINQAKIPFLVAINKIDVSGVSVDMVKAQLAENSVFVEGYGGDVVCVEISAKQKKGIDNLLEMIVLMAKMEELKADSKGELKGVVIDSRLDSRKGPVATVLVKEGTLKTGDEVFSGKVGGKVKLMLDEYEKRVVEAPPSRPVEVLGFKKVPAIGSLVFRGIASETAEALVKSTPASIATRVKIILKADTQGMLEAIKTNIPSEIEVILGAVGQVSESDVLLARSVGAGIIAFNVKIPALVAKLAQTEKVVIKTYNIIYELLQDLEKKILKILEPTIDEETLGEAEVIAEFKIKGKHVAGCRVKKGKIYKIRLIHLQRKGKIIADARIISFQKERQEVTEAKVGNEIGIVLSPDVDFKIGDVIISYKKQQ